MAFRVLQHGSTGCTDNPGLEPASWKDVAVEGQFLIDAEFLTRCSPTSGTASCLYCKSPAYLDQIARLFPWIYFYAYEHAHPVADYDPADPSLTSASPITVQVQDNRTTAAQELTKEMARTIGDRSARERDSLLLICHDVDPVRQLALQVLTRPSFALLDLAGPIPDCYLQGEIVLPLYLANDKLFSCLVTQQSAKAKEYDHELYFREMGFFQRVIRSTDAYDESSKASIAKEYGQLSYRFHRTPQEAVMSSLLSTVDLLSMNRP